MVKKEESCLCSLIHHYLLPYPEIGSNSLTKEVEKNLLIALSQVYTKIKLWIKEYESDSSSDMVESSAGAGEFVPELHADNHHCLTKAIGVLMDMLSMDNSYIQHQIGNILVAVSDFLVEPGSCWGNYINLLYHCLKVSIFNGLSSVGHTMEVKELRLDSSPSRLLKLSLTSVSWSTAAVIMKALHNVVKQLNRDLDDQIFNIYLKGTTDFISNMPWDLLSEIYNSQEDSGPDHLLHMQEAKLNSILLCQGYLLRLLCSLVKSGWTDAAGSASAEHPLIFEIKHLLPRLLASCFRNWQSSNNVAISQYLRHKMLILMIRLSNQIHLDQSCILSWLDLIHTYFQDILSQPVYKEEYGLDKYLEGSPFGLMSFDMKKKCVSSKHLQRLAIFLFLRCSFSLLNMKEENQHYACTDPKSSSSFDLNSKCCSRRKALLELHEWLGELLPGDRFVDHDVYSEKSMDFVSSFLQLYMQEDDILFEMLLQMFCLPLDSEQKFFNEVAFSADEVKEFSLVSHLFHPIHLFHLFLAGMHYDHQVLLDYLISKDTGARAAEYLLRCLRKVCDSWDVFVEFSWSGKCRSRKRKKLSTVEHNSKGEISVVSSSVGGVILPLESKSKTTYGRHDEDYGTQTLPFQCARNCLFLLKASVESLHRKNLFPYNPQVLLRRLARFQELCGNEP